MINIILITVLSVLQVLFLLIPLLIAVAYFTLAERKIMASMQQRRGPNVVGFFGLLQPLADGLKLLVKETVLPSSANTILFILAPIITFQISLMSWVVVGMVFPALDIGLLYILGVSSLGVYGIITSCWAINSKYAFLGVLRSAGQMILCKVVWPIYTHLKCTFDVLSSIALFVKQTIYCLGVEILIVYYQISFLLLVLESFNAWYWFTFLFILLLPVIGFFRFPENPMLLHGLCSCLEPLLLFLRTGALLRFGVCISVGIWFVPIVRGSDHCIFGVIITTDSPSSTQETDDFVTPAKNTGSAGSKGETPLKKEFGANSDKLFLKRTLSFSPSTHQDGSNDFGGLSGLKRHNCGKLSESPSLMNVNSVILRSEKITNEPDVFTTPESDLRAEVANLLKSRQISRDENQKQLDALWLRYEVTGDKNEAEFEALMKALKKFDDSKFFELLNSEEHCFKDAFDLVRMVPGYSEHEYVPFQNDKFAFAANFTSKDLSYLESIKSGRCDDSVAGYTWPYQSRLGCAYMDNLAHIIAREGAQADRADRVPDPLTLPFCDEPTTPCSSPKGSPNISPLTPYRLGATPDTLSSKLTPDTLSSIAKFKNHEARLRAFNLATEACLRPSNLASEN